MKTKRQRGGVTHPPSKSKVNEKGTRIRRTILGMNWKNSSPSNNLNRTFKKKGITVLNENPRSLTRSKKSHLLSALHTVKNSGLPPSLNTVEEDRKGNEENTSSYNDNVPSFRRMQTRKTRKQRGGAKGEKKKTPRNKPSLRKVMKTTLGYSMKKRNEKYALNALKEYERQLEKEARRDALKALKEVTAEQAAKNTENITALFSRMGVKGNKPAAAAAANNASMNALVSNFGKQKLNEGKP
jgi:hypothetical protein